MHSIAWNERFALLDSNYLILYVLCLLLLVEAVGLHKLKEREREREKKNNKSMESFSNEFILINCCHIVTSTITV